jgi:hypothetical protein
LSRVRGARARLGAARFRGVASDLHGILSRKGVGGLFVGVFIGGLRGALSGIRPRAQKSAPGGPGSGGGGRSWGLGGAAGGGRRTPAARRLLDEVCPRFIRRGAEPPVLWFDRAGPVARGLPARG